MRTRLANALLVFDEVGHIPFELEVASRVFELGTWSAREP